MLPPLLALGLVLGPQGTDFAPAPAAPAILFQASGDLAYDNFGSSLALLPDLDGDGLPELLAGAPNRDPGHANAGRAKVLSGRRGIVLRTHVGISYSDRFGHAVAALGDVDGDGVGDYGAGAIWSVGAVAGAQHGAVSPGRATLYSGATGAEILSLPGNGKYECFGASLAPLGDLDGDGRDDLAIGARFGGAIDGDPHSAPGHVRWIDGATGRVELEVQGALPGDYLGETMVAIGDQDLDGVPDLVAGAWAFPSLEKRGAIHVLSGATGALLATMEGAVSGERFGWALAPIPDHDGDGVGDLAVGAPGGVGSAGRVVLVSPVKGTTLASLSGPYPGDRFGSSLAHLQAGPANPQGRLAVGAPGAGAGSGRVLVLTLGTETPLLWVPSTDPGEAFGTAVSSAGDLDGDGDDELAAGATLVTTAAGTNAGRVTVFRMP